MTKSRKTSKTRQKFDFGMEPKITRFFPHASRSLLCNHFAVVAFPSEEEVEERDSLRPIFVMNLAGMAEK